MGKDVKSSTHLTLDPARKAGGGSFKDMPGWHTPPPPPMLTPVPAVKTGKEAKLCPELHSSDPTPFTSSNIPK